MTAQADLFGAGPELPKRPMAFAPPPPRPPLVEMFPTPPTVAWARKLIEGEALPVVIHVSRLWTGEIVEVLARGAHGRWMLRKGGQIEEIRADPGCVARIVYLDPTRALEMHTTRPLIHMGAAGTHSARYRLALPGKAAAALILPTGGEHG